MNSKLIGIIIIFVLFICCEENITKTKEIDTPSILTKPQISNITENSIEISWQTDIPCKSKVIYVRPGEIDTIIRGSEEFRQNHSYNISGLINNQEYYIKTASINEQDLSYISEIDTFFTLHSTTQCWEYFENSEYNLAKISFSGLYEIYPQDNDVISGCAWSNLKIDSLDESIDFFTLLYELNSNNTDALAGLTISNYLSGDISNSIEFGELLLEKDTIDIFAQGQDYDPLSNPFYIFDYDTSINNLDISIILSENYFLDMDYEKAKQQLDFLMPDNSLHPHDTTSWQINNITFDNYYDALEAYIENLKFIFDFL